MEIQLPEAQSYLDNIKNGSVTEIRLPKMKAETGEILTVFSHAGDDCVIKMKVFSSETVPLEAITAEEAEQEGFAVPDFCTSHFICGNSVTVKVKQNSPEAVPLLCEMVSISQKPALCSS
jgi:hypothetical protein